MYELLKSTLQTSLPGSPILIHTSYNIHIVLINMSTVVTKMFNIANLVDDSDLKGH